MPGGADRRRPRAIAAVAGLVVVVVTVAVVAALRSGHSSRPRGAAAQSTGRVTAPTSPSSSPSASSSSTPSAGSGSGAPVFAFYYMWWDRQHWLSRLGPTYPVNASPDPLPATLDASSCGTVATFRGDLVTDVSQGLKYDQDNPQTFVDDVQSAAHAGLSGFMVNWVGTGAVGQTPASSDYNRRLGYMFDAVRKINAAGTKFRLILNYQSSAKLRPVSQFVNDFRYFVATYGSDPVLDHTYSSKPEVVMAGTWKYPDADIEAISAAVRPQMYLIGDEKPASWDNARAQSLDGSSYYWSSQDPYKNRSSFATLQRFAAAVRATKNPDGTPKTWLAPFTPGYNAMLLYGTPTCVARNDGQTMRELYQGNAATSPDGWTLISWNEISEGSYVVPLTRYGTKYIDTLRALIRPGN